MTDSHGTSGGLTLLDLTKQFEAGGYGAQFGVAEAGAVRCFSCKATSPARELHVEELLRTEGASDPDDMAAVAAVKCPKCAAQGVLVLKYGPESPGDDAEVLRLLDTRGG